MIKLKYLLEFIQVYPKRFFCGLILSVYLLCVLFAPHLERREKPSPIVSQARQSELSYQKFRSIKPSIFHIRYVSIADKYADTPTNIAGHVFASFGGSFDAKDIDIGRKLNAALELFFVNVIYDCNEIKPGDFILFRPRWVEGKQVVKACVIEEYKNGHIKYIDNDPDTGLVFQSIRYNDQSIDKIVEHSYLLWSGTKLKNAIRINRGKTAGHDGIDMSIANYDREVYAFSSGVVVKTYNQYNPWNRLSPENAGGNLCVVKTKFNNTDLYVVYMHLNNLRIKKGDVIKKGDTLGNYADIGYSFGAHLHLSLYTQFDEQTELFSQAIDPMFLVMDNATSLLYNTGKDYKALAIL